MGWWRSSPSAARESWDPSQERPTETSKETRPENPLNSCPEGPLKDPLESLLLSPLRMPLLSPLASPTPAPSLICPAWSNWWRRRCGGSPEGFRPTCCCHRALFPAGWCPDQERGTARRTSALHWPAPPGRKRPPHETTCHQRRRRWWYAGWQNSQKRCGRGSRTGTVWQWAAVGNKWAAASAGHLRTPMCPSWRLSDPEDLGVPGDKGACACPSNPPTAEREGAEHGSLQCATPGQAAVQTSPSQNAAGAGDALH